MNELKLFKTTVIGVGPFCIEFPDGEIIHTRSEERQKLIASTEYQDRLIRELVAILSDAHAAGDFPAGYFEQISNVLASAKAQGYEPYGH